MHTPIDPALRVRILGSMVGPIEKIVDGLDTRAADPIDLGLATMLADDLDRHLTALADSPVAAQLDRDIDRLEDALDHVRTRLAGVAPLAAA